MAAFHFNPDEPEIDELIPPQYEEDLSDFVGLSVAPMPSDFYSSREEETEDDIPF